VSGVSARPGVPDKPFSTERSVSTLHGITMTMKFGLAILLATVLLGDAAHATCKTIPYRFHTNGDTVTTSELLASGDTCFHTLRNNAGAGNVFTGISVDQSPGHGKLTIAGTAFQYRAQPGYRGTDRYAVKICMRGRRGSGCSTVIFNSTIE